MNIPSLIRRAAKSYGDAPAVMDQSRTLSFREVDDRSSRLANVLTHLSPDVGSRVALLMPNRAECVECDFGIAKAGKVRVPVNSRLVAEERRYIVNHSGADTVIVHSEYAPSLLESRDELPCLKNVLILGEPLSETMPYEAALSQAAGSPPNVELLEEAPSFILYTSGTTGRPKGATGSNRSRLAATVNMWLHDVDAVPGDAMVHVGSMAHGSGSKALAYFLRGARNIAVSKFDPEGFLRLVERERATATFLVPTMINFLLEAAGSRAEIRTPLKTVSYGGAPIAAERLQEAMDVFGNVFVQVYGSCEAPHPVCVLDKEAHAAWRRNPELLSSIGREAFLVDVQIVDGDGHVVSPGDVGEMWVRGDNVMTGYWDDESATTEVFSDGWYKTGDLARNDERGFVYIVGRQRETVITGGLNVYPSEVEAALLRHPAVRDVAVIGVPDDRWGESVLAFVIVRPGTSLTEEELIEYSREHLAGYKKPKHVVFVKEFPRGASGKTAKRELRAPYWADRVRSVN